MAKNLLRAVKRSVMRIIVLPVGRCRFLEENESGLWFRRNKIHVWRFTECTTPYNRPSLDICTLRVKFYNVYDNLAVANEA